MRGEKERNARNAYIALSGCLKQEPKIELGFESVQGDLSGRFNVITLDD